jgi:hypothetical protein
MVKLYRGGRETAKEQKSITAKESIIKSNSNPKGAKELRQGWNLDTPSGHESSVRTLNFGGGMTKSVPVCHPWRGSFATFRCGSCPYYYFLRGKVFLFLRVLCVLGGEAVPFPLRPWSPWR